MARIISEMYKNRDRLTRPPAADQSERPMKVGEYEDETVSEASASTHDSIIGIFIVFIFVQTYQYLFTTINHKTLLV